MSSLSTLRDAFTTPRNVFFLALVTYSLSPAPILRKQIAAFVYATWANSVSITHHCAFPLLHEVMGGIFELKALYKSCSSSLRPLWLETIARSAV